MNERTGRVLVVDDSEDDQLQLRRLLRREFEVSAAFTGPEALERLERARFDVLITDQKMPRMSGDALIAAVKSNPATAGLRCILLSGRTSDEQLVGILRAGRVFHYFEKHKTLLTEDGRTELILAVRNAVSASRLEQERGRLTDRLQAQVDAASGQYKLLRALVDVKDPGEALRLVLESLKRRLRSRAVIAVLDLRPDGQALGQGIIDADEPMTRTEMYGWQMWAYEAYVRLSGRELPDDFDYDVWPSPIDGSTANTPRNNAPTIPVFVNRDLRGLLVLVRPEGAQLETDEQGLFEVWRDQLQDALDRMYTRRLDELRRIELMVEAMTEGVVLTDETGSVTLVNPVARRMLAIGDAERPDFSVIVGALGLQNLDVLRQLGQGEAPTWRPIRRGDAFLEVLFSQVRDHGRRSVGILTVIRDVTTQRRAEQRRDEFVHIVSHELRSPLTSIGGVVDLLRREVLGHLSERQHEYLTMAKDACSRINGLVDDMLDLAKFEQGKMPLRMEPVHLESVVEETVRAFEPTAIEKGITLAFDCPLGGLFCQADADRLGQVVSNLLSNAFKFTPQGGTIRVEVFTAFSVPELYMVSVYNSGAEIPEDSLEMIFERFEQSSVPTMAGAGAGTGLGLSICRTIIQGHRGEIWVESGQGRGTTFVFSLPALGPEGQPTGREARPAAAKSERPVLVVTAEEHEGAAIKAHLLSLGFRTRLCPATLEALQDMLERFDPLAAICLDVDDTFDAELFAELASHHRTTTIGMLSPGAALPPAVDLVLEVPHDTALLGNTLNVVLARLHDRRRIRVLLIDRDRSWAAKVASMLDAADYLTYVADDAETALARIERLLPDLVILDLAAPDAGGIRATIEARVDPPIQVLFTRSDEPPFDLPEAILPRTVDRRSLLFQVRAQLTAERRPGLESLAALPGAREAQREIQARIRDQQPFAATILTLDGLDHGVEQLGVLWGHSVMAQTAELIHQVLREYADDRAFLGHMRGHDYLCLMGPTHCRPVCEEAVRAFDRVRSMIIGRDDAPPLRLMATSVIDRDGRFDRYAALTDHLARLREYSDDRLIIDGD